jgi:hypothetical protein
VAFATRRRHIAIGVAAALRAINSPDAPMPEKIEAGEAADDDCVLADQAVTDDSAANTTQKGPPTP